MSKNLLNALLALIGICACLLAGNSLWLLLVALALLVHLSHTSRWNAEGKLLASTLIAGSALDSFLLQLGVFDYGEPRLLIPQWQAAIWLLLGTTLNHSLGWSARPWWRASLLGACAGPLIYYAAQERGLLSFPYGSLTTLALIALLWAALVPALHGFAALYKLQFEQAQRALLNRRTPPN
ncbi:DUF2878 domain-containing protein [Pseudomonas sp. TTU2014-080ASC]|uniref:DUF2878 domain-containing protein n=1 Tax=Pseudomonas sp. TTU2014-080ASC TaxID=1729724 RepID=UPI00071837E9|nr:DUF2878 domain-containing protein [Pseudomonas sp. TTU2014-080ASC]KRW62517.1 hypothetical protein AO726_03595 [Pseudomonas sp. TTU2014-080ASC]